MTINLQLATNNQLGTLLEKTKPEIKKIKIIMSVNFKPLADRVLVEPIAAETKTASGIIIPDTAKEKAARRNSCSCWKR